jgi:renalase
MLDRSPMFDVAVIGAGIAGLTCARQLQQSGYTVVVLEKSRGVGGRVATRRNQDVRADHGVGYLELQGDPRFQSWLQNLIRDGIIQAWTDEPYELNQDGELQKSDRSHQSPYYAAPSGMTAIAKSLATDLTIWLNQRVQSITLTAAPHWHLGLEATNAGSGSPNLVTAKALVIAIPAPQALTLLEPLGDILDSRWIEQIQSVDFLPCLSVIAGYSQRPQVTQLTWQAIDCSVDPNLRWISFDSSKRTNPQEMVFVVQSSAAFAKQYLEEQDLQPTGQQLLDRAATYLGSWFSQPDWFQIHRWRYAFAEHPLQQSYLAARSSLPLVCSGDWCGGSRIESAFLSGLAAANAIEQQLSGVSGLT